MPMLQYDKIIENKIRSENMITLLLLRRKCAHHYCITLFQWYSQRFTALEFVYVFSITLLETKQCNLFLSIDNLVIIKFSRKKLMNYLVIDNIIFSKRCASQMQLHSTHAPLLPLISECKFNGIHLIGFVEEDACSWFNRLRLCANTL